MFTSALEETGVGRGIWRGGADIGATGSGW